MVGDEDESEILEEVIYPRNFGLYYADYFAFLLSIIESYQEIITSRFYIINHEFITESNNRVGKNKISKVYKF